MSLDTPGIAEAGFGFDAQAGSFDRRAGLPPEAVDRIAEAVMESCSPGATGVVLDVGAGTGEIGARIAASGVAYLGVDLSLAMLQLFRRRPGSRVGLIQADACNRWPIRGGVRAIFVSRAVHLLTAEHVWAESRRLAREEGIDLILGAVRRDPESVRFTMRRQMRQLLAERGIAGRSGQRAGRRLQELVAQGGGTTLPVRTVATWPVSECPADALAAWSSKPGLAGQAVSDEVQGEVLRQLASWARRRYGDLHKTRQATERYELTTLRLAGGDR